MDMDKKLSKKARSTAIQKSLETREKFPISYFDSRKYIQHNVGLGDGLGPILQLMDDLPADRTKVTVCRAIEDGDYSVLHANYVLGDWGPMVGFEVHRWENDRIVEHWDNLCSTPTEKNASGRSMTDGVTEIVDLERTESNKALVDEFTKKILVGGQLSSLSKYFANGALVQHSAHYGDGVHAFESMVKAWQADGETAYHRRHLLLGEGNMVLVISEGISNNEPAAFYDLYCLANDKIAEHWEVFETIPPRDTWKNSNGKF
jgi:predicted SnoaL-like aldol condensation-catalyzing enzyme